MTTSILNDIKHILGLLPEQNDFDGDLVLLINAQFSTLTQLGVGPVEGYQITGSQNTWDEFVSDPRLNSVKTYIFLKVKLVFDPPATGFMVSAVERQILELEYRMNVVADYG